MKKKIKVLYVDDQARYRRSLIQDMTEFGIIAVGEASNGIECLEELKSILPDIVVLDLEMPKMHGSETFNQIKLLYPELDVIILSQHDDTGLMENYIYRGAKGYLPKRFIDSDVRILAEGIKAIKNGQTFFYSFDPDNAIRYTKKEVEVITHIMECKTSKEIADKLGMNTKKVDKLITQLHKKTKTRNAPEFIKYGIHKGLSYLDKR